MLEFMRNQKKPAGFKTPINKVDFDETRAIDLGDGTKNYTIHYDDNGFPDFTDHCPRPTDKYVYQSSSLSGDKNSNKDIKEANEFLKTQMGERTDTDDFIWDGKSNNFSIRKTVDGKVFEISYTWHHHQDGRTMYPARTCLQQVCKWQSVCNA